MAKLRIKDNDTKKKELFYCIPKLTEKIADKTLEQLEKEGVFVFPDILKDSEDLTTKQLILQSEKDSYRTNNVMGFLGCGNERLTIASRFSDDEQDFFFQYMLEKVLNLPNIFDLNTDDNQDNRLYNLLIFMFPYYLKTAMRKGIFKSYIRNYNNDSNIKGTIEIAKHIKQNTPFVGNIAYSQREFTHDNYLMELIRHTIEFIKIKPFGNRLLNSVKNEVSTVFVATSRYTLFNKQKTIYENRKNPIRHAFYHEYRALQRLCIMILMNEKNQVGFGKTEIYGILFDGAWLWEEYINTLLCKQYYHPMNKEKKNGQYLFNKSLGLIYPDFISIDTINRVIADAKYKPIRNIGNNDYLQVLAYMFRFDAKHGFYLYPDKQHIEPVALILNEGYGKSASPRKDVCVTKLGLRIPACEKNYQSFSDLIKISEKNFISNLYKNQMSAHISITQV